MGIGLKCKDIKIRDQQKGNEEELKRRKRGDKKTKKEERGKVKGRREERWRGRVKSL